MRKSSVQNEVASSRPEQDTLRVELRIKGPARRGCCKLNGWRACKGGRRTAGDERGQKRGESKESVGGGGTSLDRSRATSPIRRAAVQVSRAWQLSQLPGTARVTLGLKHPLLCQEIQRMQNNNFRLLAQQRSAQTSWYSNLSNPPRTLNHYRLPPCRPTQPAPLGHRA